MVYTLQYLLITLRYMEVNNGCNKLKFILYFLFYYDVSNHGYFRPKMINSNNNNNNTYYYINNNKLVIMPIILLFCTFFNTFF